MTCYRRSTNGWRTPFIRPLADQNGKEQNSVNIITMKQIKYFLLLSVLFAANSILAQNSSQAKACLDKATAIVSSRGGITARFALSRPGAVGRTSGTISVKGTKFVASTPQMTIWFNGKTQWSYMRSTNEVNISTPTEAQRFSMNPYTLLTMYRQGYSLSMTDKGNAYVVHMKALDARRSVSEVYVTVSRNYQLQGVRMKQNGKWTTITVTDIQRRNLSDAIFTFNRKSHPSAEIIDLR